MLRVLFSTLYWVIAVAIMAPLQVIALAIWLLTVWWDHRRLLLHLYCCGWGYLYVWMNPFWHVRFEGRDRIPWKGPAVLVSNHLSLLDIIVLYGLFRPYKWVAKAELFKVPFVGWVMVLNDYVKIRRGDRESIRQMMDHCRAHLERGSPVLLFPEGTRSADGHLQRFKDGGFKLAMETGVPVIPIAIAGTHEALPKRGLVLRGRMHARVTVLEPIDPRRHATVESLRDAARAAVEDALPESMRSAPAPAREASGPASLRDAP